MQLSIAVTVPGNNVPFIIARCQKYLATELHVLYNVPPCEVIKDIC